MRNVLLFFLFLSSFSLSLQAQDVDTLPRLTIEESAISVNQLFAEITRQTGLDFSFNPKKIDAKKVLSFTIKNATLFQTLDQLATQIPFSYSLIDHQIVLNRRKKNSSLLQKQKEFFTISGFLSDQTSGESLIGATIVLSGTSTGTVSNAFGYYSLRLPRGACTLSYSYVGFNTKKIPLQVHSDMQKDLSLQATSLELPAVIVQLPFQSIGLNRDLGGIEIKPADLENMPEFGGESGLIKGLQALPGIKMHSDGSAFFYTRGGEKDQNLIIIDDAPIYNPSHLFGFYSVVIPDFTKSINVYKSDIPTALGDRLSSIVDIRTKDGNLNKWEFNGALNPLINRFSLEGPIVKKKGSLFVSFRRSNFDWLYRRANPNWNLGFGDFSFKWNHRLNNKNRIYLTLISSADDFANPDSFIGSGPTQINWGNVAMTLRWNHIFGPKLFSNTIIYTGSYNYNLSFSQNSWTSAIGTLSLKTDFTHYTSPVFKSKFGLELQNYYFNPGRISTELEINIFPSISENLSRKNVFYYQGDYDFSDKWKGSAGLRWSLWRNVGPATYYEFDELYQVSDTLNANADVVYQRYSNPDPRLSLKYVLEENAHLKLSFGRYHQYMQLITNSVSPFTSLEVWLPSSPNLKPQKAFQWSLDYLKYFPKPKIEVSLAAYYKKLDNQIDYKPHANTLLNPLLEGELRIGELQSYGVEFSLKRKFGRFNGWINYTWSRALAQTEGVNAGRRYSAFQDRPHDFSMMINFQINRRILFSAYWTAYTGSAFSSPTGFYDYQGKRIPIFAEKNNDRLPAYRRFDFAFKFTLNKNPKSRYQHDLTFSIYNAGAHENIVTVDFLKVLDENGNTFVPANLLPDQEFVATQTDLIRFFPSLTYKFKL